MQDEPKSLPDALDLFRDVPCTVQVVLGTGRISLRRCLHLEPDSVIRLEQSAGEDLAVSVNGVPIAQAEVMVIDETMAVRITHIVAPPGQESHA